MYDQANEIREITTAQFGNLLNEQTQHGAKIWVDLVNTKIYTVKVVPTKNCHAMILSLLNNGEGWRFNLIVLLCLRH